MSKRPASLHGIWAAIMLIVAVHAGAAQFEYQREFLLPRDATESRELWLAARQIIVDGTLERSFFGVANHAQLNGVFKEDIWLAGVNLHLVPDARQSVRAVARDNLIFEGHTAGNLMAAAGDMLRLGVDSRIEDAAYLAAPTIIVEGQIDGRLIASANRVVINGQVGGDATIRAREFVMAPNAVVEGRLRHIEERPLPSDKKERKEDLHASDHDDTQRAVTWGRSSWLGQIYFYLAAILVGLCLIGLAPRLTGQSVRALRHSFWKSALVGVLAFILIPLAGVMVAFTFIGLPLAFLLFAAYGVLLYVSKIIVAIALGGWLLRRRGHQSFGVIAGAMLLGLLFLYLGSNLPIVGAVAWFIITIIGLGALILGIRGVEYATDVPPPVPAATRTDFE